MLLELIDSEAITLGCAASNHDILLVIKNKVVLYNVDYMEGRNQRAVWKDEEQK